jgi:hypothetical protein
MRGREEYCCSMDELYCTWRGLFIGGEDPPRAGGTWGAAARGAAPAPTLTLMGCHSPLGLVVAAARGRQHLAARVAPPPNPNGLQPSCGCSPTCPIQYSNREHNFLSIILKLEN